jgi:hypothetical protein
MWLNGKSRAQFAPSDEEPEKYGVGSSPADNDVTEIIDLCLNAQLNVAPASTSRHTERTQQQQHYVRMCTFIVHDLKKHQAS